MLEFFEDLDGYFWLKFIVIGAIFIILPVWVFTLVDVRFMYKIAFTFAGGIGLWIALKGKTIGKDHF